MLKKIYYKTYMWYLKIFKKNIPRRVLVNHCLPTLKDKIFKRKNNSQVQYMIRIREQLIDNAWKHELENNILIVGNAYNISYNKLQEIDEKVTFSDRIVNNLAIFDTIGVQVMVAPASHVNSINYSKDGTKIMSHTVKAIGRTFAYSIINDKYYPKKYHKYSDMTARMLISEIEYEIIQKILTNSSISSEKITLKDISDSMLMNLIIDESTDIKEKGCIHGGNVVLASIDVINRLFNNKLSKQVENVTYVGEKEGLKFYVLPQLVSHCTCIIGYRNEASGIDSGIIYAPYKICIEYNKEQDNMKCNETRFGSRYSILGDNGSNMKYYRILNLEP